MADLCVSWNGGVHGNYRQSLLLASLVLIDSRDCCQETGCIILLVIYLVPNVACNNSMHEWRLILESDSVRTRC